MYIMESKDNEINNEDNILLTKEFVVEEINPGLNSLEDNKTTESVKKKFPVPQGLRLAGFLYVSIK